MFWRRDIRNILKRFTGPLQLQSALALGLNNLNLNTTPKARHGQYGQSGLQLHEAFGVVGGE